MPRLPIPEIEKAVLTNQFEDVEEVKIRRKDFISEIRRAMRKRYMAETSKNEQIMEE